MTTSVNINIKKVTAMTMAIVVITISFIAFVPVKAVTSNGFCYWTEVCPANNVLFSNVTTGITENNDNYDIFCACARTHTGYTYFGVATFVTTKPTSAIGLKNVNGGVVVQDLTEWKPVIYNNETVGYMCNPYAISESFSVSPNYEYTDFTYSNAQWYPTNELANQFIEYALNYSPPSPVTPTTINYELPPGNIAIIETDTNYSAINLTTTMPLQSTSFASNPWPNTTQRIGYYSTLPQTLNPNTMGNVVEWERNGNTTLFNITTSAKYNPSVVSTFKYVVIANPYYYPANDMEDSQYTNGAIKISMDGVVNITVKSLTATVNTQTGAVEDNYNGEEWTGEVDETTNDIIWTDSNGDNNAPTSGGNLSDPSITGFQSWLKGILNNIVNIFQPAHDAINTLAGAVSNFASWMYALYVWLPSPILSLLTSAISLAIVIGIIKVFI